MNGSTSGSDPPSISGSKSVLYPEHITFRDNTRFKSSMAKILLALVVIFAIIAAVFMGLFVYYYAKYESANEAAKAPISDGTGMTTTQKPPTTTTGEPAPEVCSTRDCVIAAAEMAKKMDLSYKPCDDFSQYACGTFIRTSVLPEGRTRINTFSEISDDNKQVMKSIIEEEAASGDPNYLTMMRHLYTSCFDEAQIEVIGLDPYTSQTEYVNDWPTLNPDWDPLTFNLNDLVTKYEKVYIEPLYVYYVSNDMMDSNQRALYLSDPTLGLSQEYFSRPRNDSVIMAYEKYLIETAVALGADRARAEQDAKDVVDLEIAISKIMVPREDRRDSSKQYNPITLNELGTNYPGLDIPGAFKAAFETAGIPLADNERVINRFPTYIGNLTLVTDATDNRIIQNLFGFKYALSRVGSLTKKMREIRLDFDKIYQGKIEESPRWEVCLSKASDSFWKGMAKQYVARTFSEEAKDYMNDMIANLKTAFRSMVAELTWMSDETKQKAYEKVNVMRQKIGYPDYNFTNSDLEKYYTNYTMVPDNYFQNLVELNKLSNIEGIQDLRKPVDKNEWRMAPYVVNAYFARAENDIVFPAGILQPPFFSQSFLDAANYGGIGVVIGHEITHGFDDQGSQYDAQGNLNNWWQPEDRVKFLNRTQCIVDQYSGFKVEGTDLTLNGINTQGESVADNGGVKESYRAYKSLVARKGKQATLPGLGLTQDQVFFLAYGQVWCEKMTLERTISQVLNGVHPIGVYRIIGALQNSEDFARAYNCPVGSYMNPVKKCSVW